MHAFIVKIRDAHCFSGNCVANQCGCVSDLDCGEGNYCSGETGGNYNLILLVNNIDHILACIKKLAPGMECDVNNVCESGLCKYGFCQCQTENHCPQYFYCNIEYTCGLSM